MNGIRTLALLALGGLSACGGGGDGLFEPLDGFEELEVEAAGLIDSTISAGATRDLPTTGSATYEGVMGLSAPGEAPGSVQQTFTTPDLLGDLTLQAQFANRTISGTADNFYESDGTAVTGDLDIAGGTITTAGTSRFSAGLSGTLTRDGTATSYLGEVDGQFFDGRGDNIAGTVTADATTGAVTNRVNGAIIAEETD